MNTKTKLPHNKNLFRACATLALVATALVAAPGGKPLPAKPLYRPAYLSAQKYVPGEVLVQYKPHVDRASARFSIQSTNRTLLKALRHNTPGKGAMLVARAKAGRTVEEEIAALAQDPDVEYAQPNYIYHATATPANDTQYASMWGLKNTAQTIGSPVYTTNNPGTSGMDIGAESAWDIITNCSSVVVAVIDSGVNYNHEDLDGNMVNGSYTCPGGTGSRGCDFVGTGDADPMDLAGHGTHVAGTIGAEGNNSQGVTGICWTASILAVRVLDETGSGTTADIVEGLNFAAATGAGNGNAKVVNMSLGGSSSDSAFNTAITTAQTNDVVVVVAAGNAGANHNVTATYPCDYTQSNIICVAALDQSYSLASFSDYDANVTPANRKVDIGAPGTNVMSTYAGLQTIITEDFNSSGTLDWTLSTTGTAWGYSQCLGSVDMLLLPNNCTTVLTGTSTSGYAANTNSSAYKAIATGTAADSITVSMGLFFDLENGFDGVVGKYSASAGDPTGSGTSIFGWTGELNGTYITQSGSLSGCVGSATCTIGFLVQSDSSNQRAGVGVFGLTITTLDKDDTNEYKLENGTSMASPHVAGIATMVRARNPSFTYTDTVNAILGEGDVIGGNTKTGRAADAYGALKYIPQTTGLGVASP